MKRVNLKKRQQEYQLVPVERLPEKETEKSNSTSLLDSVLFVCIPRGNTYIPDDAQALDQKFMYF